MQELVQEVAAFITCADKIVQASEKLTEACFRWQNGLTSVYLAKSYWLRTDCSRDGREMLKMKQQCTFGNKKREKAKKFL